MTADTATIEGGPELEEAVAALWSGFDNAVTLLMMTVDLVDAIQRDGHTVNVPLLRKKLGEQVRAMIADRDRVLAPFGITPDDDDEA